MLEQPSRQHVIVGPLERVEVDFPVSAHRALGGRVVKADGGPPGVVMVRLSTGRAALTDQAGRFLFREVDEGLHEVIADGAEPFRVELGPWPKDHLDLVLRIVEPAR